MEFSLPELGEGVSEGELVKWSVKLGDEVAHDQPICEIMTDKATIEIPSPHAGKVTKLHAKEGDTVGVGDLLISYDGVEKTSAKKAPAPEPKKEAPKKAEVKKEAPAVASAAPSVSAPRQELPPVSGARAGEVQAAPATRRFARTAGIDIAQVSGSGPGGRVMKADVETFLRDGRGASMPSMRAPLPSGGEKRVPFKGLRKKIAEKMRESKDRAAHFTYVEEADATALVKLRQQAKEIGAAQGVKVTFLPFILKAMVATLRQFPILNSSLDEEKGELVYKYFYNIGLSIQTEDGLTAPNIKNVEHKSVLEIAREIQILVDRARSKKLTLEDFKDSTITLTNAGSIGGLFATPVINYPEVAILGFNKIFKRPVVKTIRGRDRLVIRHGTYFSLSLDHRVVDGAVGAEFMNVFVKYIENPSLLLMESF